MAALVHQKHEQFAQLVAQNMPATEAYKQVYKIENVRAIAASTSRLLHSANVLKRISELRAKFAIRTDWTVRKLIDAADEVRVAAMAWGNPGAAIAAVKEIGILTGLRVERREQINFNIDEMSDAELVLIASGGSAGTAAASRDQAQPDRVVEEGGVRARLAPPKTDQGT